MAREFLDYPSWRKQWEKEHDTVRVLDTDKPHVPRTYDDTSGSRRNSMTRCFKDKADAVRFVNARLRRFQNGLPLTITIKHSKYVGYSVSIATGTLSDDTQTPSFCTAPHGT